MVGITERNKQKQELTNRGFAMKYIDEWQPKTTLYRHKASLDSNGNVAAGVGSFMSGVPGNPDYVLRKANMGLFPWEPSESCTCKWCQAPTETVEIVEKISSSTKTCDVCGIVTEAANAAGASSKMTFHKRKEHPDV
tara:strand:+ start:3531 stop:3941 length:411 start_codon:yes stop_codon:yes gene_type:complete